MKKCCTVWMLLLALGGCGAPDEAEDPIEIVTERPLVLVVDAEGELRSTKATPLNVPGTNWAQRQLVWMKPEGSLVASGEVLARFAAPKGELDLAQAELDLQRNALTVAAKSAELDTIQHRVGADLAQVDTDLGIAQRYADAPLEMYARNQILDALQDVGYLGSKQQFLTWKRSQAGQRGGAELAVLDSQRASYALNASTRKADLSALELRAPNDGVLLLTKNWAGDKPKIGASLWAGTAFGSLPDAASMEVSIALTQLEAQGVKVGAAVELFPIGHPEQRIDSTVSWVASAAQAKSRQNPVKYLQLKVPVPSAAIERYHLVPGQVLQARVYMQRRDRGLSVPNIAIRSLGGKTLVHVREGSRTSAREIALGERNSARSEVLSGLAPGDAVLLVAPPQAAAP